VYTNIKQKREGEGLGFRLHIYTTREMERERPALATNKKLNSASAHVKKN
jgi:hypothetical protein